MPGDIIHDTPRVRMYKEREAELDRQDSLDALEDERDMAKACSAFYQQQARRYQSREVRAKTYNVGELVLRLSGKKKDKLKPKLEGPFIIDVTPQDRRSRRLPVIPSFAMCFFFCLLFYFCIASCHHAII